MSYSTLDGERHCCPARQPNHQTILNKQRRWSWFIFCGGQTDTAPKQALSTNTAPLSKTPWFSGQTSQTTGARLALHVLIHPLSFAASHLHLDASKTHLVVGSIPPSICMHQKAKVVSLFARTLEHAGLHHTSGACRLPCSHSRFLPLAVTGVQVPTAVQWLSASYSHLVLEQVSQPLFFVFHRQRILKGAWCCGNCEL
jgi:hypothetical protein